MNTLFFLFILFNMNKFIISLIITFLAGLSTLIGGFIPFLKIDNKDNIIISSLGFASGIMISISIFDLIPSAYMYLDNLFIFIISFIIGGISFYLLDKIFNNDMDNLYRVGIFSMIAIIIHNIPEGVITFFLATGDIKLGLIMGISIALHNIPEGISIMVPTYYGSGSIKKAFVYTLVAGIAEPIGGVIFYLLFKNYINNLLLGMLFSFTAGVMIYLSLFELLPKSFEYQKKNISIFSFMIGIIFFLIIHIFLQI